MKKGMVNIQSHNIFPGEVVFVCNFDHGDIWLAGIIRKSQCPQTYVVKLSDDRIVCCHIDHIHPHSVDLHIQPTDSNNTLDDVISIPASFDSVVPPATLVAVQSSLSTTKQTHDH